MKRLGLISIAGNIGVGKTTLAQALARILPGRLILEEYDKNPFLVPEFTGQKDAALPSELFFLLSRVGQLQKQARTDHPTAVCDYIFEKNRIFARINLPRPQFALYCQIEERLAVDLAAPDLVIYLHDTVENCLERIACRGRDFEKTITADYLLRLQSDYHELFRTWNHCPLITIDCGANDLRRDETIDDVVRKLSAHARADSKSSVSTSASLPE